MNLKTLYESNKQRVFTGLVMAAFASLVAFLNNALLTWLILGVMYLFAFYEAMNLFDVKDNKLYVYAVLLWLAAFIYPNPDDLIYLAIIGFLAVMAYTKKVDYRLLAPFLYPSVSMLFLYALYHDFGMSVLVWLVIVVALTDTGAYFVGKSIGKTSFSPTSPNKTLEGVIGGVLIGTVVGALYGTFFISLWLSAIIALVTSIASVFGDLFESYLKREAGLKDSGNLFPGHGGMLDRLDGYLFGGVVMVILLRGLA
ncbi:phosphatidate cytidylyltransferase [Sulfurospirillum multivorans]|uniref:Phosphatidate cytidylyltransferase n=2 Tax=Sulfurospirillum multivorans TaxID=66821 RepID=A0AA86E439_SULMK|nr:phosphatidate cytidylyltransferase [Sulfurospirillum multivorans]AHJ14442.1 phosphatidate cytidylyltransferase [Sulfurospirillum multivorans DSM 12446]QEH07927.1 phosphatidate cytidylyltransferase [Sulfurospirillum multivorans]